jgi:hypothetical protein
MRKFIIYSAFFISILLSCTSEKDIVFNDIPQYKSNEEYKNLYVVDSIQIDTPVRFFTKSGYEFIMSKKDFDTFNGIEKELFERNDAFLIGNLPMLLPVSFYNKYNTGENCYKFLELSSEKKKDIRNVYFFDDRYPDFFLLMLVNGDYYNHAFCGIDGPPIVKDKRKKFNYYKVVIPVCP